MTGPRLPPRSGLTRQLVIILHGYGADGNDLIPLGQEWQTWLPDAAFYAPDAPEVCMGGGKQWFPLTFRDPDERWRGVNQAAPALDDLIDREVARHRLQPRQVALVGFSQGCMMALHVGLRRPEPVAGLLGLSGMLVAPAPGSGKDALAREVKSRPPILLIHGEVDDVIPADALFDSAERLAAIDTPCEWHLSPGLAHGIDGEGLRQGGLFLARCFGLPYPAKADQRRRF